MSVSTPSLTGAFCATADGATARSVSASPTDLRTPLRADLTQGFIVFLLPTRWRQSWPERRVAEVKVLQIDPEPASDRQWRRYGDALPDDPIGCIRRTPGL